MNAIDTGPRRRRDPGSKEGSVGSTTRRKVMCESMLAMKV